MITRVMVQLPWRVTVIAHAPAMLSGRVGVFPKGGGTCITHVPPLFFINIKFDIIEKVITSGVKGSDNADIIIARIFKYIN